MKLYTRYLSPQTATPIEVAPSSDINTTPLVGVLMALVIMLMITVPVPLYALKIDMPSRQSGSMEPEIVVVEIDAQGFVFWAGTKLTTLNDISEQMAISAQQPQQPEIHVLPAPDAPYGFVTAVLIMAKKAGLQRVGVTN